MATPTLDELAVQVQALTVMVAKLRRRLMPDVAPVWGSRGCAVCGQPAVVIDIADTTLEMSRNGEGYCLPHATSAGVLAGDHLTKP